jgi:signal peptidase I
MAEEKITLRLAMVSIPIQPAQPVYAETVAKPAPVFHLGRFIQQSGILALIVVLSIACYFTISHFFVETVQVVGVSMVPTLEANNHYLLNRWAFHNREPEQGEVVVITDPADKGVSVKRIVAVSGQSVHFKDGKVFINGKELKEPYLAPATHTYTYSQAKEQFITCGKDQYFVLGDNRLQSIDSRSYGPVPRENILGLVVIR